MLDIAEKQGMDRKITEDLLKGDADTDLVFREAEMAQHMGITGVPAYFFAGRYWVGGAQEAETLKKVMVNVADKLAEEATS